MASFVLPTTFQLAPRTGAYVGLDSGRNRPFDPVAACTSGPIIATGPSIVHSTVVSSE
jgi:hypothetical protein